MEDVQIAITIGSSGEISLANEIRLVKPALLYADHVVLYSPVAALLQSAEAVGHSDSLMLELARQVGPMIDPTFSTTLQKYDELAAKNHKTRSDMQTLIGFRRIVSKGAREILLVAEGLISDAGGDELLPAIEAGLVTVDPLFREDGTDRDLMDVYLERLQELLNDGHAYPLFDDQIGSLVRQAVAEGAWELGATPTRRGKQVSAASQIIEQLPAFPGASVSEILGIRDELRAPLVRFRSAVTEMARVIASASYEGDFAAEVDELYLQHVAPALQEISELVEDNGSMRQLARTVLGDAKPVAAAVLTLGMTLGADLPRLVSAAFNVGVPLTAAVAQGAWTQMAATREIERRQLFFLYRTAKLLDR